MKEFTSILFILAAFSCFSCSRDEQNSDYQYNGQHEKFAKFASKFRPQKLPFSIEAANDVWNGSNHIEQDSGTKNNPFRATLIDGWFKNYIPEVRENKFGRNVITSCSCIASLYKNDKISALCYHQINGFEDSLGPRQFIISTYNTKTGQFIDRLILAGKTSPYEYLDGVFNSDLTAVITTTKNTWLKKPEKFGFQGNQIVSKEAVSQITYHLESDGHFKKIDEKTQIASAR